MGTIIQSRNDISHATISADEGKRKKEKLNFSIWN
jgi:hypothetical protein